MILEICGLQVYPEEIKRERDRRDKFERRQAHKERRRAEKEGRVRKKSPVAFLFPGQGSQMMGMLKDSLHIPAVQRMLDKARDILGYDLCKLCTEGPLEQLNETTYSQPALFVAGLAAVERAREVDPQKLDSCSAVAGLSLGEYTALVFAGALTFEEGLRIVKIRAESMAEAARMGEAHGMLSIVGLTDADIKAICADVRAAQGGGCVCELANYLFPQGRVVSGHIAALDKVKEIAIERGALKAQKLAVSGAFHTSLMRPARDRLLAALEGVTFREPSIPVFSNVTAEPVKLAESIPELLGRQLVEPVLWEDTLKTLIEEGYTSLHELGPNRQIKAMVKRIDADVWKKFSNIAA